MKLFLFLVILYFNLFHLNKSTHKISFWLYTRNSFSIEGIINYVQSTGGQFKFYGIYEKELGTTIKITLYGGAEGGRPHENHLIGGYISIDGHCVDINTTNWSNLEYKEDKEIFFKIVNKEENVGRELKIVGIGEKYGKN